MWNVALGFVAGVLLSPKVRQILRPAVKEVVKAGLAVGTQIQQVASGVKEDFEDITAEASAELRKGDESVSTPPAGNDAGEREN